MTSRQTRKARRAIGGESSYVRHHHDSAEVRRIPFVRLALHAEPRGNNPPNLLGFVTIPDGMILDANSRPTSNVIISATPPRRAPNHQFVRVPNGHKARIEAIAMMRNRDVIPPTVTLDDDEIEEAA